MDNENNVNITLNTDHGDVECTVLTTFDIKGINYIALLPLVGAEDDILLFRYTESGEDSIQISEIESDAEFESAVAAFDDLMVSDSEG
jgi:hypothetical protein